ncbi:hypothetical protein FPZ08_06425 [Devosia ginsengisoli]|uniref:Uncharacterized protein n=2 Tax=Devosia ginsengisoli TaxID=400770 RepID=A0A5B8LY13_9HYPH|nr:hypothetical protein FPZ08_06425 [Devosia ginsengisoli]
MSPSCRYCKRMDKTISPIAQAAIWDFYKPRHTHTWNMLVLSWRAMDGLQAHTDHGFEVEYLWENFIFRLWLYRTAVKTLTRLGPVEAQAQEVLDTFDKTFEVNGRNGLKALRDMLEHFDDYASGKGRGPATRADDLDPWRTVSIERYERGQFTIDRRKSYDAAMMMRSGAHDVEEAFLRWYRAQETG